MPELYELGRTRARLQPRIQEFGRPLFGGSSGGFSPQTTTAAPEASGAFGGGSLGNIGTVLSALSALRSAQQSGLLDEISGFLPSGVTNLASRLLGGGATPGTAGTITPEGLFALEGAGSGPSVLPVPPVSALTSATSTPQSGLPVAPTSPVAAPAPGVTPTGVLPVTSTRPAANVPATEAGREALRGIIAETGTLPSSLPSAFFLGEGAAPATQAALSSLVGPTVPAGTPAAFAQALPAASALEFAPGAAAAQAAGGLGTLGQFGSALGSTLAGTNLAGVAGPLGAAAFPAGTSVATALGTIAPPVAAFLAAVKLGSTSDKHREVQKAAVGRATDLVTKILTTSNPTSGQLERAKALLGQPNTFEDPNPGTQAHFGGIENRINALGGIDALSPAAPEIYVSAIARRQADRIRQERAAAEQLGAPLLQSQGSAPVAVDFQRVLPGSDGQTFGATRAGHLMQRQGLTARQALEAVRNEIGSGGR